MREEETISKFSFLNFELIWNYMSVSFHVDRNPTCY